MDAGGRRRSSAASCRRAGTPAGAHGLPADRRPGSCRGPRPAGAGQGAPAVDRTSRDASSRPTPTRAPRSPTSPRRGGAAGGWPRPWATCPPHADRAPGDAYAAYDTRDELARAVLALPPRMRAVVVLRYFDDLSEADTAAALGMSVGSVKSQASRGWSGCAPSCTVLETDQTRQRRHRREEPGMSIETQLREALSARADEVDGAGRRPLRAGQRRHRGEPAPPPDGSPRGVAAVAVIAVAIPSPVRWARPRHHHCPPRRPRSSSRARTTRAGRSVSTWPTRGRSPTDTAFLTRSRERLATATSPCPLCRRDLDASTASSSRWAVSEDRHRRRADHATSGRTGAPRPTPRHQRLRRRRADEAVAWSSR